MFEKKVIIQRYNELCDLFYMNLQLLIEKYDIIMSDPCFYSIRPPKVFCNSPLTKNYLSTLGNILPLWVNEPFFSRRCECGGKATIYQIKASNLAGKDWAYTICLKCKKFKEWSFKYKDFWALRNKYQVQPVICKPVSIRELLKFLIDEQYQIDPTKGDDLHLVPIHLTYEIWKNAD